MFSLGNVVSLKRTGNNAYAKFGGTDKDYYRIFQSGLYGIKRCVTALPHVRDACLFFLNMTGFLFFVSVKILMINRLVAKFLTSEKDLFRRINV